jgi:hypothetical protein
VGLLTQLLLARVARVKLAFLGMELLERIRYLALLHQLAEVTALVMLLVAVVAVQAVALALRVRPEVLQVQALQGRAVLEELALLVITLAPVGVAEQAL